MVICHIITALGFGGAERLLVDLTNIQAEKHDVHIVYLKDETLIASQLSKKIHLKLIPLGANCASQIREFIIDIKPELVHTHVGHADFVGQWAIRGLKIKRFCTMHNIRYKWNWKDNVIFAGYRLLFATVARSCKVIAISKAVENHVRDVLKVSEKNIRVIRNAVPDISISKSKSELRRDQNISPDSFNVVFVGRVEAPKLIGTLLMATKEIGESIPGLSVQIVGGGSMLEEHKAQAVQLGVQNIVQFHGSQPQPERFVAAADVFVLPSKYESFGLVILEAFRSSVPVITTNIQGPKELVSDGINGLLFEPGDHKHLAGLIVKLYGSGELRERLGKAGYDSYKGKYDIHTYSANIEALYRE
jgi:glycosyltransferase involved in cell wall biosynthesis